jgi:hypothetical protein
MKGVTGGSVGLSRDVRHRLRRNEYRLRIVGDVLLMLAILCTLGLVVAVLLSRY